MTCSIHAVLLLLASFLQTCDIDSKSAVQLCGIIRAYGFGD